MVVLLPSYKEGGDVEGGGGGEGLFKCSFCCCAVMFLRRAMRYYRLWIYTCNAVLLASVILFVGVALRVASHPYLALVQAPTPYHPTLLYGYVALLLQAGILQALGCLGALRLSQRLLNAYWVLLLLLLVGDVAVGLVWLYRFSHLSQGLESHARATLRESYGVDEGVTGAWDALQREGQCCGVVGPGDYNASLGLPPSCCARSDPVARHVGSQQVKGDRDAPRDASCPQGRKPYPRGCSAPLERWLTESAETLMILGFCVISFVKLCFVGILRLEIQEMIQKIRVLQGEGPCLPSPEVAAALGLTSPGAGPGGERSQEAGGLLGHREGGAEGEKEEEGEEEEEEEESCGAATPLARNHVPQDAGAESDTNSHCALITDTPVRRPQDKRRANGNNNDVTELRELRHVRQTQI